MMGDMHNLYECDGLLVSMVPAVLTVQILNVFFFSFREYQPLPNAFKLPLRLKNLATPHLRTKNTR